MYDTSTQTRSFDMSDKKDVLAYNSVIADPLCTIVSSIKEKLTEKELNSEGEPSYIKERIVLIVTWQQKRLLED